MADLKPGDIVRHDAIHTTQIRLGAAQNISKGDFLVPDAAGSDTWDKIGGTGDIDLSNGIAQAQADFDNTDGADGALLADVFIPPSVVIGKLGGDVSPTGTVKYSGGEWVAANAADFAAGEVRAIYIGHPGEEVATKGEDGDDGMLRLII